MFLEGTSPVPHFFTGPGSFYSVIVDALPDRRPVASGSSPRSLELMLFWFKKKTSIPSLVKPSAPPVSATTCDRLVSRRTNDNIFTKGAFTRFWWLMATGYCVGKTLAILLIQEPSFHAVSATWSNHLARRQNKDALFVNRTEPPPGFRGQVQPAREAAKHGQYL
jgi:hypothetical protein